MYEGFYFLSSLDKQFCWHVIELKKITTHYWLDPDASVDFLVYFLLKCMFLDNYNMNTNEN